MLTPRRGGLMEIGSVLSYARSGEGGELRIFNFRRRLAAFRAFEAKQRGVHQRECPICYHKGLFTAFGDPPRWDARCPGCGSLERHRLLALFLLAQPNAVSGRVVHFAPEPAMRNILSTHAGKYQSADLSMGGCDLVLNIEEIQLPDASVDTFVASHVLEHVDDQKALSELNRCLRPGGRAIIMVPVVEGWSASYENPALTAPEDRRVHFGQHDHVRWYGRDVRDRIRSAGFHLSEYTGAPEECIRYGLLRGETLFVASK